MAKEKKNIQQTPEVFSKDVLRANCKQLFNIEKEIFDGVFFNFNEELSKEEAQKKIDEWLGKEVK